MECMLQHHHHQAASQPSTQIGPSPKEKENGNQKSIPKKVSSECKGCRLSVYSWVVGVYIAAARASGHTTCQSSLACLAADFSRLLLPTTTP
uniref:Uncharacterized protein n=1 Tax=Ditylenchus dipsaci TaxID=166011 RepID=A0A915E154_9BILA